MIDVHIGFMDEEVSQLLRCLIKDFGGNRPVLAIERGQITKEDFLFETPFRKYADSKEIVRIIPVEYTVGKSEIKSEPQPGAQVEGRLAHYLYQELIKAEEYVSERIEKRVLQSTNVKLNDLKLSVIRFNPAREITDDPIILVRNPEMGLQPSIVRPYERAIFKAISRLQEAHMYCAKEADLPTSELKLGPGIRLHSFASGGAIKSDLRPGSITKPLASLYIGSEVDEQGRLYSVVNLVALRKMGRVGELTVVRPQHFEFFRHEALPSYVSSDPSEIGKETVKAANKEATDFAQQYVLEMDDPLLHSTLNCLSECYKQDIRREKIVWEKEELSSGADEITANFSYFDDLKTKKELSERFKNVVVNSNMEDYHVLRLARSMREKGGVVGVEGKAPHKYGRLIDVEILRVNANVNIPHDKLGGLEEYLSTASLSKEDYIKSILWGLKGCPLEEVPNLPEGVNQWIFYRTLRDALKDELPKYVYVHKDDGKNYCMDPFCCEIATDLLKDLEDPRKDFLPEIKKFAGMLRNEAKKLTWADNSHDAWKGIEKLVEELVGNMAKSGFSTGVDNSMYCWLRPGDKWKNIGTEISLIPKVVKPFLNSGENVDRLFYKSANLVALQRLAPIASDRTKILL